MRIYLPAMLFSSWVGTYADLIMVKKQLYSFPIRPFAQLFEINVAFTLLFLPAGTVVFLLLMESLRKVSRALLIFALGFLMPLAEQIAETFGRFAHAPEWRHSYSLFGYMLFLYLIWKFHLFWAGAKSCD